MFRLGSDPDHRFFASQGRFQRRRHTRYPSGHQTNPIPIGESIRWLPGICEPLEKQAWLLAGARGYDAPPSDRTPPPALTSHPSPLRGASRPVGGCPGQTTPDNLTPDHRPLISDIPARSSYPTRLPYPAPLTCRSAVRGIVTFHRPRFRQPSDRRIVGVWPQNRYDIGRPNSVFGDARRANFSNVGLNPRIVPVGFPDPFLGSRSLPSFINTPAFRYRKPEERPRHDRLPPLPGVSPTASPVPPQFRQWRGPPQQPLPNPIRASSAVVLPHLPPPRILFDRSKY